MKNNPQVKRILYATDLGEHTRPVFRFALSLADKYEAEVYVIHVAEPISATAEAVISTYLSETAAEEIQKSGMKEVHDHLKNRIKIFCEDESINNKSNPESVSEILVVSGKPSEEILRVAEDNGIDIIVMGKSSRKVRGTKVMGSTARRVSRHANTAVLVVSNRK